MVRDARFDGCLLNRMLIGELAGSSMYTDMAVFFADISLILP